MPVVDEAIVLALMRQSLIQFAMLSSKFSQLDLLVERTRKEFDVTYWLKFYSIFDVIFIQQNLLDTAYKKRFGCNVMLAKFT